MIGAAIRKDVGLLLRDRGALISLFALPIVFIVTFGSMFSFGPDAKTGAPREIPIFAPAGDQRGEAIVRSVGATPGFTAVRAPSADEVRRRVAGETAVAGLVVPPNGEVVELVIDLAGPVQVRGPVEGSLSGAVLRAIAPVELAALPPVVVAKSPPGLAKPLEDISPFQVTVPANAVLFGFFIALTVAMAFVGERRTGTWRRLLAAPVPRSHALLATLVPYYLVGLVQLAFLFGIGALVFGMRVAGSLPALVALSLVVSLCAVSLGLLFAAIATTEKQLGGVGSVVLLVMGLIGGCMFPRIAMPEVMRDIGLAVPHSWALDGFHAVLVREGTTIADIAPALGALGAFSAGFIALGLALFRFER